MDIGCDMGFSLECEFETSRDGNRGILDLKLDISNDLFFDVSLALIDDVDHILDYILDLTESSADLDWD